MIKKLYVLLAALTVTGCVTTGSEPANVRSETVPSTSSSADDESLKTRFETLRVVPMAYDEAWNHVINVLPGVIEPLPPSSKASPLKFQKFDKTTGVIEMRSFRYIGASLPGGAKKEVVCKATRDPNGKYMTIRIIPAGENTLVSVDPTFAQLLKEEEWAPQTFSGRVDALGMIGGSTYAAHKTASAVYDKCVSTGAIENLIFKSFPEKTTVSPVRSLAMGGFHRFYSARVYWDEFRNGLPDVSAPHFLARQEQTIETATKYTRAGWEEDATTKKDGFETDSILRLGIAHAMGYGVPRNGATAAKWFRKKASNNYIAQYDLGMLSLTGNGVPKNEADAAEWFQTAALSGGESFTMAKNNLAVLFAKGHGVRKDEAKAVKLFKEIMALQKRKIHICNVKTVRNLGYMYENGLGVPRDETRAYGYYFRAAQLGDIEAQKSKDLIQEKLSVDQIMSILGSPEFQMADCSPIWSGGWHEVP